MHNDDISNMGTTLHSLLWIAHCYMHTKLYNEGVTSRLDLPEMYYYRCVGGLSGLYLDE